MKKPEKPINAIPKGVWESSHPTKKDIDSTLSKEMNDGIQNMNKMDESTDLQENGYPQKNEDN